MPCAKCQKDKPTPVTYKSKLYCLMCAAALVEEASDQEAKAQQIRDDLKALDGEMKETEAQIAKLTKDRNELVAQREALDKKIEEANQQVQAQEENRLSVFHSIDKLTAELEKIEKAIM